MRGAALALFAATVGTALAAVVTGSSSAGASQPGRAAAFLRPASSVPLVGSFQAFAADGRVAVAAPAGRGRCRSLAVWVVGTRSPRPLALACRGGDGIDEIAVADGRIAWLRSFSVGHTREQTELVVSSRSRGRPRQIADANEELGSGGRILLSLRGQGRVLAVGMLRQDVSDLGIPEEGFRPFVIAPSPATRRATLCPHSRPALRPAPPPARLCVSLAAEGAFDRILAVEGGRIVLDASDALAAVSPSGRQLWRHPIALAEGDEAALAGGKLVILRATKIEIYDANTGRLVITRAARGGRADNRLTAAAGFAAFRSGAAFRLVRLSDGRQAALAVRGQRRAIAASLVRGGLFYLYATRRGQRIAFAPARELTRVLE